MPPQSFRTRTHARLVSWRVWGTVAVICSCIFAEAGATRGRTIPPDPVRAEENGDPKPAFQQQPVTEPEVRLAASKPVICIQIRGYNDFSKRPNDRLTKTEKLCIYYEPQNYAVKETKGKYNIHLVQDMVIRKKGTSTVLWSKRGFTDIKFEEKDIPGPVYLESSLDIRKMRPGSYEAELILYDKLGDSAPLHTRVDFHVVESPSPEPDPDPSAKPSR